MKQSCVKLNDSDEDLWKIDKKECPRISCSKCNFKTSFHPLYIEAGIIGCISGACEKIEDVSKRLLNFRKYTFICVERDKKYPKIKFKCRENHEYSLSYENLRKGDGCILCKKKKSVRLLQVKKEKEPCECKEKGLAVRKSPKCYVCPHYNFAVIFPEKSEAWAYDMNGDITPYDISPGTHDKYWFYCPIFDEYYEQSVGHRTSHNSDCPYCIGKKLCIGNSLLGTHPEIAEEWDECNDLKSHEISHTYEKSVWWVCSKKHKYKASPTNRTGSRKTGCPECNSQGYEQFIYGHTYFVEKSNKIHDNKYEYPEKYINNYISGFEFHV